MSTYSNDTRVLSSSNSSQTITAYLLQDLLYSLVLVRNGSEYYIIEHPDRVWSIDVSPDGRYIASGCRDQNARLWRADNVSGSPKIIRPGIGYVWSVQFSPSGNFLATGGYDGKANVWTVPDGVLRKSYEVPDLGNRSRTMPGLIVNFASDGHLHAGGENWGSTFALPDDVT